MSAPCGCTAVWGWSPARKSFWSAGGITYDANQTSGTCAHRNVFQRPDTNFRMQGRREEGWLTLKVVDDGGGVGAKTAFSTATAISWAITAACC